MLTFFCAVILGSGTLLLLWMYAESHRREINSHRITVKKKISHPFKILHLSDIHFSRQDKILSRFFDRLAGDAYDFIFITGDVFDCASGISAAIHNLKKLKAVHGIYAVFGNHDYYDYRFLDIAFMGFRGRRHPETTQPVEKFVQALEEAGVKVLFNESVKIQKGGTTISIHGLDDPTTGRGDIEKAMHHYKPEHFNVLLSHTVDAFFYIGEGEVDLSFSGHSHGGQIRFPFIGPVITHTQYGPKYASGVLSLKGAVCSISRGMNASRFFSLRLLCPPEAIVLHVEGS